jgi:hypothetical protein
VFLDDEPMTVGVRSRSVSRRLGRALEVALASVALELLLGHPLIVPMPAHKLLHQLLRIRAIICAWRTYW